jgi:PAS domain S-box-containing protein
MLRDLTNRLCNPLFRADRKNWFIVPAIFLAIISPVILLAAFSYVRAYRDLTDATLSRRQAIAYLTAATLKGNLDRLIDIGTSLATRVRFRQLIGEGKWDEAVKILRGIPKDFPFIDRLILSDLNGTLMADTPELPEVRGKNFAARDWYRGVSSRWEPYISEVYKRAAEPRLNVVAVAVPIKIEDQKIIGILVLQVRLDTLFEWTKGIDVGPLGFAYFVDKKGHVAAHPGFSPQGEITDYSKVPVVEKVLQGKRGVEIAINPVEKEERIAAYEPVPDYGWGVIAQQPTLTAFAVRDGNLRLILIAYGSISLLSVVLAYLIVRAFTGRKLAEAALRESEARFRALSETANDAIISANSDGRIVFFNSTAERIFGYRASEVIDQPLTTLMPDRFHNAHQTGLARYLSTGVARVVGRTTELTGRRKDGTEFPIELSLASWRTGDTTFFTGIIRDITERKKTDDTLKMLNEQLMQRGTELEAANKELESFSYSVSHDLRAPLRHVAGYSELLKKNSASSLDDKSVHYLNAIIESAGHMGNLIDDLLGFSRIARTEVQRTAMSLDELVQDTLRDLRMDMKGRTIAWKIDPLPRVEGDPPMLRLVFTNLISNALKFTRNRPEAKIEIGSRNDGNDEVVVFIRDNGVGFETQYVDKLFNVFQRLHSSREFEGTGIGLATVRRIIERHRGRVWAEGSVDSGATFYISLPRLQTGV